jgi:hypothetical protein
MNVVTSTAQYDDWLKGFMQPITADVRAKHKLTGDDRFSFFRATFYRWAQLWPTLSAPIADAPMVHGIGDAHVENFGTWRDREGRLIWGVNDFDESATLPYTNDLVRLAVSGLMARERGLVRINPGDMLAAILLGYGTCLDFGGAPFVIEERNTWLRDLAEGGARTPQRYWEKMTSITRWRGVVPKRAAELLHHVPKDARQVRIVHRISGAGSLGRPRLAAVFEWRGGYLAREVKARAPSAWMWAGTPARANEVTALPRIWKHAVRCPDPYLKAARHWISRRMAPDCSRIDLADLPRQRQEIALFRAMGWDVANIHLGSETVASVRQHFASLDPHWLNHASEFMHSALVSDFRDWKRR